MKLTALGTWLTENAFELLWFSIVLIILIYAIYNKEVSTIDKILIAALTIFKGIPSFKKVDDNNIK